MRHFLPSPPAIAVLAFGMGEAASARFLVALTGRPHGSMAGGFRAPPTAVEVAAVAVAADHHLAPTTGAVEQTRAALHRLLLPMRAGSEPNRERYSRVGRASHGLGARHRVDCGGQSRCRACLNGSDDLTDCAQPVTPSTHLPPQNFLLAFLRPSDRYSPPSLAILRVIHQQSSGSGSHPQLTAPGWMSGFSTRSDRSSKTPKV